MPFTQPKRLGFVALTFGLLLRMCFAGHYDVSYSGGTAEWVGPLGGHYTVPYTGSGGGWGGSAVTSDFVPPMMWIVGEPGWTHCHGSITVTFTWNNEGDASELPPTTAILKQVGMASWSGDSGSCADGLGDGQVLGDYSGTSSGTHYEIVGNPGPTFTRTITPDANSTAALGGPSPEVGAASGVSYQGTLTPVVLNISGVTKANSMKNALIGQHLTATLTASGYTLKTGTFVYSHGVVLQERELEPRRAAPPYLRLARSYRLHAGLLQPVLLEGRRSDVQRVSRPLDQRRLLRAG